MSFYNRLLPIPKNSGFRMDGYFVWCGSAIYAEGMYYLFASRWPKETSFPAGYLSHSEIVRAVSDKPEGPYTFEEVIIRGRGGNHWDAVMAHNPTVKKVGGAYVLFYIGSRDAKDLTTRSIGYAVADSIKGVWKRSEREISIIKDSNNPSALIKPDGSLLMAFRHSNARMGIMGSDSCNGKYTMLNPDIMPEITMEDPYLFFKDGLYHIICEDGHGTVTGHERFGAHLISENGIDNWRPANDVIAYDHTLRFDDGSEIHALRRERPQLLFDDNGNPTHLYTSVQDGDETYNICQPLKVD